MKNGIVILNLPLFNSFWQPYTSYMSFMVHGLFSQKMYQDTSSLRRL